MRNLLKLIFISLASLTLIYDADAQSYAEGAMLFSRNQIGGTARVQAMGGAQTSLGGDVSLAQSNPAGLGMFNRSAVTFSLGMSDYQSNTMYLGNTRSNSKFNLSLPQLGAVFYIAPNEDSKYKGGSFGINVNTTNNYNKRTTLSGVPDNSIIDYFLEDVDGLPLSAFEEGGSEYNSITGLGWFTYLVDTVDGFYDSYVLDYPEEQRETNDISGRQTQWSFSYGGNYDDMIFFGAGIGITSFRYSSEKVYEELFPLYDGALLDRMSLEENLFIDGTGINATMGLTVRPVSLFQVGMSYTTPTRYNVNDNWDANMETVWTNNSYPGTGEVLGSVYEETALIVSDYSLTSPSKFNVGGAVFIGKYGFLTADFERINYGGSRLSSRDFSMEIDNEEINSVFGATNNYRLGAEFRMDIFRVRGGYSIQGDPYKNNELFDSTINSISGGIGIRTKSFFADLAVVNSTTESGYFPLIINGEGSFASTDSKMINGMITVGFNF